MNMRKCFGVLAALFLILAGGFLVSCNISAEAGEDTVTITLSDSLAKYDSIRIILSSNGTATDSMTVKKPYATAENGRFQVVMHTAAKPPENFTLIFVVFGGNGEPVRYKVEVTPEGTSKPERLGGGDGGTKKPTAVEIVTLSPLTLIEKGQPRSIEARVLPAEADQGLTWSSLDTNIAKVDASGRVTPGTKGDIEIVATSKVDGSLSDRILVKVEAAQTIEGIKLTPSELTLYVGGEAGTLKAAFLPEGAVSAPVFSSDDTSKAQVSADGRVTAKAAGKPVVRAYPEGFPSLIAQCTVTVILDKPVLDVGNDRKVAPGGELSFPIKVTQQYGKVDILRWDLDGDGKFEDSTKEDHAEPKHTYNGSNTEVKVSFYVRDTEGNVDTTSRKVLVGSLAPLVEIIRPRAADTLVNVTPFLVEYLVDGQKKTVSKNLVEGANPVEVSETNEGGTGRDNVILRLDTKAPVVRIKAPARGLLTNKASVEVQWTVDSAAQTARTSENLEGQGPITLRRDWTDSAGNTGFDTVTIFRDIDPPAAPRFANTTTPSPTKTRKPTWNWTVEGETGARYGVALDNATPVEGTAVSYTPDQDLTDGDHTLSVYAIDAAGNKGEPATHRIRVQTKGAQVVIKSPENGLVTRASSVAVVWTVDNVEQTTRTSEDLRGIQGPHKIKREHTDDAGNYVADSISITRDTIAPPAPTITVQPPAMINAAYTAPIQWTWTRNGTASDTFLIVLNGGTPIKQTGTSYTLSGSTNQTYLFEVREKDAAGNESEAAKDTVLVDRQLPPAPVVGGVTPSATPTWTWTRGAGSDGNSRFRYRLSTQTTYSAETAALSYSPANLASGSYTLLVQERDVVGNWSADGQATIVVDRSGPSLAIISPTDFGRVANFNAPVTGSVSDAQGVAKVEYRLNAGTYTAVPVSNGSWTFTATYGTAQNTVWIRAEDNLGNKDSLQYVFYKYPNVIFVRKGMSGTGKSWEDAYGELHEVLDTTKAIAPGTEIWVTVGKYTGSPNYAHNTMYLYRTQVKILGGFSATQPAVNDLNRDFTLGATALHETLVIGRFSQVETIADVVVDGFTFRMGELGGLPSGSQGNDCGILAYSKTSNLIVRNIKAHTVTQHSAILNVGGNKLTVEQSEFTNIGTNIPGMTLYAPTTMRDVKLIKMSSSQMTAFDFSDLTINDSHIETRQGQTSGYHFQLHSGDVLIINNSKVQFGVAGIWRTGTPPSGFLNYNANNVTIP